MNTKMPTTIKSKLRLIVVMTTGIALLCAFSILIWHDSNTFKNKFINDLKVLAHLVGSNSNAALLFHDNDTAYLTLTTLKAQPHIQRAIIFDLENKVFADYTSTQIDNSVPDPAKVATGVHFYDEQLAVVTDISFDKENIGRLYLLANFDIVKERLIEYSILSINILLMSLFIAYLFGNRLIQSIIKPIFGLTHLAETIAKKNDISARADKQDIYELSLLANSFNQMLDDIELSHTSLQASEQRLTLALDASGESLWEWNLELDEFYFDERISTMLNLDGDKVSQASEYFKASVHEADAVDQSNQLNKHLRGEIDYYETECRIMQSESEWIWVHIRGKAVKFDENKQPTHVIGTYRDITERKNAEVKISQLAKLFDTTSDGVIILKPDFSILTVNDAFTAITGYTDPELVGKSSSILHTSNSSMMQYENMRENLLESSQWQGEFTDTNKSGKHYILSFNITAVETSNGEISHYIGVGTDITSQREAEQRLIHLASHDALTGLPNRRLLIDRLEHSISVAKRAGKGLAVIFFDLDRFKQINDTLGHEVGDDLLVQITKRLKVAVRESDTVSRMGGDEFVLILDDIGKSNSAAVVARNIVQQFEAPFEALGNEIRVTPSLGICVYPDNGDNSEELIKNADTAMFSAKNLGRNNYQFYTPEMNEKALGRLTLENHLRVAQERNELSLYYQPKIDCRTQQIIGAEALLRWRHPELGFVSPGEFIPLAEETGLIVPIGQWVLEQACRDAKSWQQSGLSFCPVAVNISPLQFRSTDLPLLVGSTLAKHKLDAGLLELELTESLVMDTPEKIILHLQVLKNIGVKISIDDFGTGYSSLSYLQKFPIDTLKIDQSFVATIDVATQESAITKAIIAMAHSLDLNVIAEGVETLGQLEFLQNLGCYQIQGFLFSKPIPHEEFMALLQSQREGKDQASGLG